MSNNEFIRFFSDETNVVRLAETLRAVLEFGDARDSTINIHFFEGLSALVKKSPKFAEEAIDSFGTIQKLMNATYRFNDFVANALPIVESMAPDFYEKPEPKKAA